MKKIIISDNTIENIINDYTKNNISVLELTKRYNYKYDVIYRVLKENNIKIKNNRVYATKYSFDEKFFDVIDTEEKAYWLGFIYADGYIMKDQYSNSFGLALSVEDIKHLVKFKKCIKSNHPIHIYTTNGYSENKKYCRIKIYNNILCEQLFNNGVFFNKTTILKFPNLLNEDLIRHFIRGYLDGDGCITYNYKKENNYLRFQIKICGTMEFLNDLQKYLPFKKQHKLFKRHNDDVNNYSLEIGGNKQVGNILNYLYNDSHIYLDRKYDRYLFYLNNI
jgi:intein-encoded DNA endonuclease-like protein